jgi:hypothetical protein
MRAMLTPTMTAPYKLFSKLAPADRGPGKSGINFRYPEVPAHEL